MAIVGPVLLVVLPTTIVMGFTFPASSALLDDDPARVASSAGKLLAANTLGAITATFAIPFVVIPRVGSPMAVAVLALINVATALALVAVARNWNPSLSRGDGRRRERRGPRHRRGRGDRPARSSTRAPLASSRRAARSSPAAEDEIASVQAGRINAQELWVTGTSMTLLTVDAKLMPVLPLMLRPDVHDAR